MAANDELIDGLSEVALKELKAYNAELLVTIGNIEKASKFTIGAKTPSQSNAAVKQLTDQYAAQEKTIANLQAQLAKLAATQRNNITVTNTNTRAVRDNAVANQILRAEQDRNYRAQTLLGGAYARGSAQLNILKKNMKDAAFLYGENSVQVQRLSKEFSGLDNRIRAADKVAGDFQRQVGNYSNGVTKGLAGVFSGIRQLAYILPGLGVAGIIGFATEPLINYIQTLDLFKKKTDEVKESKRQLADISKEAATSSVQELASLQGNLAIAKDLTLSYKERSIAVDNLQRQYPFYFENLTKEQILAGDTAVAEAKLTEAIIARAKANAAIGKITENEGKIIDLEEQKLQIAKDLATAQIRYNNTVKDLQKIQTNKSDVSGFNVKSQAADLRSLRNELLSIQKEINTLEAINNRISGVAVENQKTAIGLDYKQEKSKKAAAIKREDLEAIKSQTESYESLLRQLEANAAAVKKLQEANSDNNEEWLIYQKILDQINRVIKEIKEGSDELRKSGEKGADELKARNQLYLDQEERLKALKKATDDYIGSLANSALGDMGLGSLQKFFDGTFERLMAGADSLKEKFAITFQAIGDVAQEALQFVDQLDQQRFEAANQRLEQQYKIAEAFAGESETAQAEVRRQYEERQKELSRQRAEQQKKLAVFNSIINTLQGVTAALATANVPLAVTIGIIGAAQTALIQSQQIPEYYKGTDNAPGGWAWTQERGREIITDKHGNVKSTGSDKGAVLTKLAAGDKVKTAAETNAIFDRALNNMLFGSGIAPVAASMAVGNSAGIDYDKLGNVILNGISRMPEGDTTYFVENEYGKKVFQQKNNVRIELMNNQKYLKTNIISRG